MYGIEALAIEVEVHLSRGLPAFDIVGLPQSVVKEGRKRIRSAILCSGYDFPVSKITVNLAPADLKKGGARFDLPIALGILAASQQISSDLLDNIFVVGELGLDGGVRGCPGGLATMILAKKMQIAGVLGPEASMTYSELLDEITFTSIAHLGELKDCQQLVYDVQQRHRLFSRRSCSSLPAANKDWAIQPHSIDGVIGHAKAKRLLMIAAAGFHSLLISGSPGVGKTMLVRALSDLLPPLSDQETIEIASVVTADTTYVDGCENIFRPVRAPHHSVSLAGFLGSQQGQRIGDLALAHRGLMFMDEFPEFRRDIIEALREPLEEGRYRLSRAWGNVTYPSRCLFVAAMNPCPCGYFGDSGRDCQCSITKVQNYQQKVSTPIVDRIDLHMVLHRQDLTNAHDVPVQLSATAIKEQIELAVQQQRRRFVNSELCFNSELRGRELYHYVNIDNKNKRFLLEAVDKLKLSHRSFDGIVRVSRTIADLEEAESIERRHLLEALQYRQSNTTC